MAEPDRIAVSFPEVRSRDGYRVPAILLEAPASRGGAADRAIGFSPSVVRGISASGRTMMTTFTSPRVREDHPGYLLEILAAMPPIPDDGKPRFVVHSDRDVPGIMAGLQALSLRNLE